MKNYPMEINGWNFTGDAESMVYSKDYGNDKSEAVALCWLDLCEGEEGYNPEGDSYVLIAAENTPWESAVDSLYYTNMTFGNIMRRAEAEKELIKYMETH